MTYIFLCLHNWAKVVMKFPFHILTFFLETFIYPRPQIQFQKISWNHSYWIHKQILTPTYCRSVGDLGKLNKSCQIPWLCCLNQGPWSIQKIQKQLNQTRSGVLKTFTKQTSFDKLVWKKYKLPVMIAGTLTMCNEFSHLMNF